MIRRVLPIPRLLVLGFPIAVGVLLGVTGYTFWYGRGYAYLSDDPQACVNCHIMRDSFNTWNASSHRSVTCNGCHVPHNPLGKWTAKVENGIRHSLAFTFEDVQVLRITPKNLHHLQQNCIRCHERTISLILQREQGLAMSCTRCHRGTGHAF